MTKTRKLLFVLIVGAGGFAILVGLGVWQLSRLAEKQARIEQIRGQLEGDPVEASGEETVESHNFRSAVATGRFDVATPSARYLTTLRPFGPGHRIISAFVLENGERILVDRGFAPERATAAATPPSSETVTLRGALHWPQEASGFSPEPNLDERLWFARDVDTLAAALQTRPVLLVLSERPAQADPRVVPVPVVVDLPNNHLSYAITWFGIAAVWAAMTFLLARGERRGSGET